MDYDTQLFYLIGTSHFPNEIIDKDVPLNVKQIAAAKKAYKDKQVVLQFVRESSIKEVLEFWIDVAKKLPAGTIEQSYRKPRRTKAKKDSGPLRRIAKVDFF